MSYVRYDYAWQTPGWSAQNPVIPTTSGDSYADPGLPADVSLVRLFGNFAEVGTGRPLEGVLRLRTNADLLHVPTSTLYPRGEILRRRFTRYRPLDIMIAATDDPDLTAEGGTWEYEAHLQVRGKRYNFKFAAPAAGTELDIVTVLGAS